MDDDGIAIAHQGLGLARDGALGIDRQHAVLLEGAGGETLGRSIMLESGDAAEDFAHITRLMQLGDVAANGGGRDLEHVEQVLHGREGPLRQHIEDQAVTLALIHGDRR